MMGAFNERGVRLVCPLLEDPSGTLSVSSSIAAEKGWQCHESSLNTRMRGRELGVG